MDADPIKPLSFPVPAENAPVKRRAVFSDSVAQSQSRHVRPAEGGQTMPARRRRLHDDSLKLIDDLTNRPMDPLFSDSRLDRRPRSRLSTWATKFLVFAMCITVGFYGSLFIERLHSDPRKVVRQSLASELRETRGQADTLMNEVNDLRNQVTERSKKLGGTGEDSTLVNDEMVNGLVAVEGPGISLTLADPIAAGSDGASTPRESSGMQIRVVTDADLRLLVRLLWQAGAEGIAINGNRLGVQTSVRKAGSNILVGVTAVTSPYTIQAIGDRDTLASAVSKSTQRSLYDSFAQAGIYPQVNKESSITLEAAPSGELSYAKRSE